MENLLPFIDKVHNYFMKSSPDPEKELLYRHLKLSEEFGELSNDIMAYLGHQRQDKLEEFDKDNLGYEVVDLIITALLIGKMANINIEQLLENKMQKITQRFNNFE